MVGFSIKSTTTNDIHIYKLILVSYYILDIELGSEPKPVVIMNHRTGKKEYAIPDYVII